MGNGRQCFGRWAYRWRSRLVQQEGVTLPRKYRHFPFSLQVKNHMKTTMRLSFVALLTSLLVACGGGGGCSATLGLLPGAGCNNSSPNAVPVANAGVTQNVITGSLVTLDGSASRDANNESLTYLWQFISVPSGSLAALSSASSVKPTFTADVAGTYTLSLLVNDGKANSLAATVNVYSSVNNSAPVANAGVNQSVAIGASVTLDGTASSDAAAAAEFHDAEEHPELRPIPLLGQHGARVARGHEPIPGSPTADLA